MIAGALFAVGFVLACLVGAAVGLVFAMGLTR